MICVFCSCKQLSLLVESVHEVITNYLLLQKQLHTHMYELLSHIFAIQKNTEFRSYIFTSISSHLSLFNDIVLLYGEENKHESLVLYSTLVVRASMVSIALFGL